MRIVCMGGGTGLPVLLAGFNERLRRLSPAEGARDPNLLTAIVSVSDDGGSSGRLIDAYGTLPPGDFRNCVLALSGPRVGPLIRHFFNHRFNGEDEHLSGHSAGNLLILALSQLNHGDFYKTILDIGRLFSIQGRILLPTLQPTLLGARLQDGSEVLGESQIPVRRNASPIDRVFLRRRDAPEAQVQAMPEAVQAIEAADAVVFAPGSLYSSLMPNLLVPDIARALQRCSARRILVCNLVTEVGETDGYSVEDHLRAVHDHAGFWPDVVLANKTDLGAEPLRRYAFDGFRFDWRMAREDIDEILDGLEQDGKLRTPDDATVERLEARVSFLKDKAARLRGEGIFVRRQEGPWELPCRLVMEDLAEEIEIIDLGVRKRVLRHAPGKVVSAVYSLLAEEG